MRNADKIIIGFLIALVIGAGYFQYLAEKLNERMDEIKTIEFYSYLFRVLYYSVGFIQVMISSFPLHPHKNDVSVIVVFCSVPYFTIIPAPKILPSIS